MKARGPLLAFLEGRSGWPSALSKLGDEHVPGGARWARSFGAALMFLFLAQLASGFALALAYSPGATSAWESVARLDAIPLGHLFRALHARGADLLILALMLHLLQTAIHGAFRAPRELTWWFGILLLALIFAAAFTGSILPWDERAHAALDVARGAAGSTPGLNASMQRLLAGQSDSANLILPRAYALHAFLFPFAIALLTWLHVSLARRHGPVPPPSLPASALNQRHSYWPEQALPDALVALFAMLALTLLAVLKPAALEGPADPSSPAGAVRPSWYFRPLTELLRDLPAHFLPAIALLPLLLLLLLLALPLFAKSRSTSRAPGLAMLGLAGIAAILGGVSIQRDRKSPMFRQEQTLAAARAKLSQQLAADGTPAEGILFRLRDQPAARGQKLFERNCLACHRVGDRGKVYGPTLTDYLSRGWLRGVVVHAEAPEYYGTCGFHLMEPQDLDEESLGLLVDLLHALRDLPPGSPTPPAFEGSRRIFESARCSLCHTLTPGKVSIGPSLAGYGSAAWLDGLIHDPSSPIYFGKLNAMKISGRDLTDSERADLVAWLQTLETR